MTSSTASSESRKTRRRRPFQITVALAQAVDFSDDLMHVQLTDGRVISVPLLFFPALEGAPLDQLKKCQISGGGKGLHWEELDEELTVAGLLAGGNPLQDRTPGPRQDLLTADR